MTEWLVRLEGGKSELEYLCTVRSPNWSVTAQDNEYYLRAVDFNSLEDPRDVVLIATQILDVIGGIARLSFGDFHAAKVGGVTRVEANGKITQIVMPPSIPITFKVGIPAVTTSATEGSSQQPNPLERWIQVAEHDELVSRAFALYGGLEHNWRNLYMILEVVEDDVGGEQALIGKEWVPNGKIKLFKRTANNFRVLGREARHGSAKYEPPAETMPLPQAQSLIQKIMEYWIRSKC